MKEADFYIDSTNSSFNIFYKGYCVYKYNSCGVLRNYHEEAKQVVNDFITGKISKFYKKIINRVDAEINKKSP